MREKFMIRILFVLLICLLTARISAAQECRFTDLSKKYIYLATATVSKNQEEFTSLSKISIQIFSKTSQNLLQKIIVEGKYLADNFTDCSTVRSYITGKNADAEVDDNDWGSFIVADVNFDRREDFAVQREYANTGAFYDYFTQDKNGKFTKDLFLSEKVGYFGDLNANKKTITTYTAATTYGYIETTFKYNQIAKKWRLLKSVHRKTY